MYNLQRTIYKLFFFVLLLYIFHFTLYIPNALAISDPLSVPNNKFGIHIISPISAEASPAAGLVNSSGGDWGYITVLIEEKDRDKQKWQLFFNELRRRHLIPLVRIATSPNGSNWRVPVEGEAKSWADFLDSLNWPVKNRYVIVYNEPNHGQEWNGQTDPKSYAQVLDKTITELKAKSQDFFVLNAGFDASTPHKPPLYFDEEQYLEEMEKAVPGILNKLDGWVSHSYPNPGFVGSPEDIGRGTVRTWAWEQELLKNLGLKKNLPVFITETGWKHAEGIKEDPNLPSCEDVSQYFQSAFDSAWSNNIIVAVTPFLLDYQEEPFDHFSFKKINKEGKQEFNPQYNIIQKIGKITGKPEQIKKAELTEGFVYSSIVEDQVYNIPLKFRNTGQSIWGDGAKFELKAMQGEKELGILPVSLLQGQKIEPGEEATFVIQFKAPKFGKYDVVLQLFDNGKALNQEPIKFSTEVKSPVILIIKSLLAWNKSPEGDYSLTTDSKIIQSSTLIRLDKNGQSEPVEAKYLLPDYSFNFTLQKPYYKPKTINQKLISGTNVLDFGKLEPDILALLLNPQKLRSVITGK